MRWTEPEKGRFAPQRAFRYTRPGSQLGLIPLPGSHACHFKVSVKTQLKLMFFKALFLSDIAHKKQLSRSIILFGYVGE